MKPIDINILTVRMPAETNEYVKERAREIGVSKNSFILMLIDAAKKRENESARGSDGGISGEWMDKFA